jgi:hypothetical protein
MLGRDDHHMTQVYGSADWYQSRPEPERIWTGTLEERRVGVGPEARGGLSYVLVSDLGQLNVYAANAEGLLAGFCGRSVRIRGKLVDLTQQGTEKELWPASIEGEELGPHARRHARTRRARA